MSNNPQSVKEIKAAIEAWGKALAKKDLDEMHKDYAEEYRLFDVGSSVEGVEATKELWKQCFPYFDKPEVNIKTW